MSERSIPIDQVVRELVYLVGSPTAENAMRQKNISAQRAKKKHQKALKWAQQLAVP